MSDYKNFNTKVTEDSTNVWLTPPDLLKKLGTFDLDPCAVSLPRPWDCATTNYTVEDDGLSKEWKGRIWLNPPYGREIGKFLKKMSEGKHKGLALIFARTDTKAFRDYVFASAKYMFFIHGRIKFCRPDGTPGLAANAPSVLIAWDQSEEALLLKLELEGLGKLVKIV